jgi:hypothetical protein
VQEAAAAWSEEETEALRGAIREGVLVAARYNGGSSILAPYTVFSRRGELYLRAVTVARDGREPGRLKLGTFKLAGLSRLHVTDMPFSKPGLFRRVEGASGSLQPA